MKFYDREMELEVLLQSEKQAERSAVFTVLTGRRRVGKTSLINKALEGKNVASLFVSKDGEAVLCSQFQQTPYPLWETIRRSAFRIWQATWE